MTTRKTSVASSTAPLVLLGDIRALIEAARQRAVSAVNSELTMLYWRIGQRIHTQVLEGRRADYGEEVVLTLAAQLVKEYGGSFAVKNLRRMVQFAAAYPDERIVVSLIRQLRVIAGLIRQTVSCESSSLSLSGDLPPLYSQEL